MLFAASARLSGLPDWAVRQRFGSKAREDDCGRPTLRGRVLARVHRPRGQRLSARLTAADLPTPGCAHRWSLRTHAGFGSAARRSYLDPESGRRLEPMVRRRETLD